MRVFSCPLDTVVRNSMNLLGNGRERKLTINSVMMLFCQFMSIVISFLLTPIIMRYIGVSDYGVWITLIGIIEWFNLFDIGLGHGLRNRYAEAKAKGDIDAIVKYVSTAFFMLLAISSIVFLFFSVFASSVNWSSILNAPQSMADDLRLLALCIGGLFCVRFVVNIINVLLTADQSPALPAITLLLGNALSLLVVYILTKTTQPSLLKLGVCFSISNLLPLIIGFIYFFGTRFRSVVPRFSQFSKSCIRLIFSLGLQFFLIQITAMLLFTTNNLIIAHTCKMSDVTEFNVAYKYMNIIFVAFMTMITPLWSLCTDAYTRGDTIWIERIFKRMNKIWIFLVGCGIVLLVIAPITYWIWLKDEIKPDFLLLGMMLVYMVFWMRYTLYRTFMNGTGKIRLQFYITSIEALLHIPLSIIMGHWFGVYGVLSIMIIWAVINSIWEPRQYKLIMTNSARGVWGK